jgi:hypothetical protein
MLVGPRSFFFFFFFFQICEVGGLAIAHKENLAKFGYTSKRPIEKVGNRAIIWLYATIYCLNMATSKTFPHNVAIEH